MVAQIIELTDQQSYLGQTIENVFHYVDTSGAASIPSLLSDYVTTVLPSAQPLQHTGLQHTNIRWRKVSPSTTLTLDYSTGLPIAGTDASDPMASCDAASFKWTLGNPTVVLAGGFTGHIPRGGARLGGLSEGNASGNGCGAGFIAAAVTWFGHLQAPGGGGWQLCVASFLVGNHTPGGPPRARAATVQAYTIVSGASQPAPSTQNSRKFLRGRSF